MPSACGHSGRAWILAALAGMGQVAVAQTGSVHGRILRIRDTSAVSGAMVELLGARRLDTTNANGAFRLDAVPHGAYALRVRRIGYLPIVVPVDISDTDTEHTLLLPEVPTRLPGVTVEGQRTDLPRRFYEAYRRSEIRYGYFFTAQEIDRINPFDMESLFYRIPGARINERWLAFGRCDPTRGPAKVQVWIDGFRITRNGGPGEARDALRLVHPSSVQIMEVYTSVSSIPAEFYDDACAVVAIWTKSS